MERSLLVFIFWAQALILVMDVVIKLSGGDVAIYEFCDKLVIMWLISRLLDGRLPE